MTNLDIGQAIIQLIEDEVAAPLAGNGVQLKVYADNAPGVDPPYVVVIDSGENDNWQSAGKGDTGLTSTPDGDIQVSVFATDRGQAASIGKTIRDVLTDAPLTFQFGTLLEIASTGQSFSPEPEAGLGEPSMFHRVLMFHFAVQRS